MNTEIVRRLRDSFLAQHERSTLVAEALLESLDDAIIEKMADIVMRNRLTDEEADIGRDEDLLERLRRHASRLGGKKS